MNNQIKLWEILVPTIYEDTKTPVRTRHHKRWDEYVKNISNGLTILKPVKGYWVKNNQTYIDRNIPVRVACTENQIEQIAKFTKNHYRQLAIMYYEISNNVYIV